MYNSEYSDKSFIEKRDLNGKNEMDIGYKYSPIKLNKFLAEQDNWNEDLILERANLMVKKALEI